MVRRKVGVPGVASLTARDRVWTADDSGAEVSMAQVRNDLLGARDFLGRCGDPC